MKKYLLLLVAAATMLASGCLKSSDADDLVFSTTFYGKVVKNNGEPLANTRVSIGTGTYSYYEILTAFTDTEGKFSFTIDYNSYDGSLPDQIIIKGELFNFGGYGQKSCDLGTLHMEEI